jgi:hypothetical protein
MCSVSAGAAALALTLVIALFGIFVRGHTYDGRPTERLNISIIERWHETWHLDHPTHWLSAWSPVPDNSASRAALQKTEISPAGSSSEDSSSVFEERFSLNNPSASFGERFVGEFKSLQHVALNAVKVQLASLQSGMTAETELPPVTPHEASTTGYARSDPIVAAPASSAPRLAASPSVNNAIRMPKARQASLQASLSSAPDGQNRTAIYDISSQVVYLPDGRKLEAHSGLGSYMDDPRYVERKNEGPTPPNTYRLALRESLFHGVRAIRLIPIGDGNMFGRDGILAHHYLLGPNGQSNGCVSLPNYSEFLNAYLNGDIDRLVVVDRLENPPGSMLAAGWLERAVKGLAKVFDRGSGT